MSLRYAELIFTGVFPPQPGGIGTFAYYRYKHSAQRWATYVLAGQPHGADNMAWDQAHMSAISRFAHSYAPGAMLPLRQMISSRRALCGWLKKHSVELVTVSHFCPFGVWAAYWKRRQHYGLATIVHGNELPPCPAGFRYQILKYTLARTDVIVANSRRTAQRLGNLLGSADRIVEVPPPINTDLFKPSPRSDCLGFSIDGPILLSVGALTIDQQKGMNTVLRVTASLKRHFPALKTIIVGDGDGRAALERLVSELGLKEHVLFLGNVTVDKMPAIYSTCDVFVLPARTIPNKGVTESFGLVYREAMACGKPAVVSRAAGISDYLTDGVNALLVDPENVADVAAACKRLINERGLRETVSYNGMIYANQSADWRDVDNLVLASERI